MKVKIVVQTVVQIVVKTGVETVDIYRQENKQEKDNYFSLLNKINRMCKNKKFADKLKIISDIQKTEEYNSLSEEEKYKLYTEAMGGKKI